MVRGQIFLTKPEIYTFTFTLHSQQKKQVHLRPEIYTTSQSNRISSTRSKTSKQAMQKILKSIEKALNGILY